MLKKTIKFKDLDDKEVSEDFYFSLSKAEIAEMELSFDGGFSNHLKRIVEAKDGEQIILTFKKILEDSVGRRSEDGRRFIKSPEITAEFFQSDAYSVLFMELVTDENKAAAFTSAILPSDMVVQLPDEDATVTELVVEDTRPAYIRENRDPTPEELRSMSKEELQEAFAIKMAANKPVGSGG